MEKIGLHNYEAFFLDHLEGNLSAQQEFELMDFLDKNPELKAELDMDLSEISLQAEEISVDKSALKKEGVQADEVDDLMIASVEGILSVQDKAELSAYVKNNGLQKDLKYYQNTTLVPDLSERYGNKRNLKKRNRFAPILYPIIGAAAVAIAIWGINSGDGKNEIKDENMASVIHEARTTIVPKTLSVFYLERDSETEEEGIGFGHEMIHSETTVSSKTVFEGVVSTDTVDAVFTDDEGTNPIKTGATDALNNQDKLEGTQKDEDETLEPIKPVEKILDKKTRDQQKKDKSGDVVTEEPIKVFTNLAENVFNKDISYKRDRNTKSDQLVSHHVKIGRFEFQRKKH